MIKEQEKHRLKEEKERIEKDRRKKIDAMKEDELLDLLKKKEAKKQVQETTKRWKDEEYRKKVKEILENQKGKIKEREEHLQQLQKEREQILDHKKREITEGSEWRKEYLNNKIEKVKYNRAEEVKKL